MYMHMLGYPTHFGQMETLKLIASSGFPEKVGAGGCIWVHLCMAATSRMQPTLWAQPVGRLRDGPCLMPP